MLSFEHQGSIWKWKHIQCKPFSWKKPTRFSFFETLITRFFGKSVAKKVLAALAATDNKRLLHPPLWDVHHSNNTMTIEDYSMTFKRLSFFVHQMQEGKHSLASLEISMPGCLDIQMSDTVFSVSFGFSFAQQRCQSRPFIRNGFRTWSHVAMSTVFFSDHGRSLAHIHIIYRWYIIKSSCSFCHHYCCRQSLLVIFYLSNYTLGQMGHICKTVTLTQVSQKSFFTESGFYQYGILVFVEAGPSFISNLGSENGTTTPMSRKRQLAI